MAIETYYYGKGKVDYAIIGAGGVLGPWTWLGDVSAFAPKFAVEKVEHKESYSGKNALVRSFVIGNTGTVDMTWHQLSPENLALALQGSVVTSGGGTVTDEELPAALAALETFQLAQIGISELTIEDSATTPVELLRDVDYTVDDNFGTGMLINVADFTPPFVASYTYAGTKTVGMFAGAAKTLAIRYRGVNLAEENAPVEAMFYKMSTDPLQELALITTGNDVAGAQVTGNLLLDSSKPAGSAFGQFGYVRQVTAPVA